MTYPSPHRRRRRLAVRAGILAGVATAALGLVASPPAAAEGTVHITPGATAVPGHYIVVLADGETDRAQTASSIADRYGGEVDAVWQHALHGFAISTSAESATKIAADPRVAYVQQDHAVKLADTQPSPPSWGLDRVDQRNLPLDNSFTYPNTASNVTVYVIDTGIRTTHVDFGGRATWGTNTVDSDDTDCHGHGTHVAGTVGGSQYGVAKGVGLVAVKVLDCGGWGTATSVINGVDWVTGNAARPAVANMSLGGGADPTIDAAVRNSIQSGISYAIAAGNNFAWDACDVSPARVTEAITVGATDSSDARASFSNIGTCLDMFAPGVDITSAWATSDTAENTIDGTSMATPHVAGAAALHLATHPDDSPAAVQAALVAAATPDIVTDPGAGSPNRLLFIDGQGGPGRAGMTWTMREPPISHVGSDAQTNPYTGDTPVSASLPLLCVRVDGSGPPAGLTPDFYHGWAAGWVGLSPATPGTALTSRAAADGVCSASFGAGWRMGEFHDGGGGWSWWAFGALPTGVRFWVAINDQLANPWDSPSGAGMTWTMREPPISHVGSDAQTNPYTGDTPVSASLPLLCVRVDGSGPPAGLTPDFYHGWAAGWVGLSPATPGTALTSRAAADGVCSASFGAGWRMGEFHDGGGGWSWWAFGALPTGVRFWVAINDQPANPWN